MDLRFHKTAKKPKFWNSIKTSTRYNKTSWHLKEKYDHEIRKIITNSHCSIVFISCLLRQEFSASASRDAASEDPTTPGSSSPGDASFSVIIDGTTVSGNVIDEMQLTNTAFIYPASENSPKRLLFFLNSNKKGDDFYSFRFSFPDKEGVYKFNKETDEDCHCYIVLLIII